MKKGYAVLLISLMVYGNPLAQTQFYTLSKMPLADLSAFRNAGKNWEIVGSASAVYTDFKPKTKNGSGVLLNNFDVKKQYKSEANLFTQIEHGDIFLSLDFMIPRGSNSGIYLQGRYEIQLFDSWGIKNPRSLDCGSIYERWDESKPDGKKGYEGHPARVNAAFAPNLWQHLEIEFQAPAFDKEGKKIRPAKFVQVTLNGVVIHENVIVNGPTRASAFQDEKSLGPLMIQGDHGPVLFRDIRYALLNEYKIRSRDISYQYYEGKFDNDFSKVLPANLVREGKSELVDLKLADNPNNMNLVFKGKIAIEEASLYQFILKKIGSAKLIIDGDELIKPGDWFADQTATINLSVGVHTFELSYIKNFSWAPSGLGLLVGKENSRPNALHTNASLPKLPPTPLISVASVRQPEILRSFMMHDGKKKTHVISVGDPNGINYSYDLKQGALLQCWKGEFLNVTDMWYERGEPQVAEAMGAIVVVKARCPLAFEINNSSALPDTLDNDKELIYKGYNLNEKRLPMFQYQFKESTYEDLLEPDAEGKGLTRTLTFTKIPVGQKLIIRLAEGDNIIKVAENTFAIGDQSYYLKFKSDTKLKAEVKQFGNKKELVIQVNETSGSVQYTVLW